VGSVHRDVAYRQRVQRIGLRFPGYQNQQPSGTTFSLVGASQFANSTHAKILPKAASGWELA